MQGLCNTTADLNRTIYFVFNWEASTSLNQVY